MNQQLPLEMRFSMMDSGFTAQSTKTPIEDAKRIEFIQYIDGNRTASNIASGEFSIAEKVEGLMQRHESFFHRLFGLKKLSDIEESDYNTALDEAVNLINQVAISYRFSSNLFSFEGTRKRSNKGILYGLFLGAMVTGLEVLLTQLTTPGSLLFRAYAAHPEIFYIAEGLTFPAVVFAWKSYEARIDGRIINYFKNAAKSAEAFLRHNYEIYHST